MSTRDLTSGWEGVSSGLRDSHPRPSSVALGGASKQAGRCSVLNPGRHCAALETSLLGGRWLDAGTLEQSGVYLVELLAFP